MSRNWFERLVENTYIEAVLLADNQGRVLKSSRPLSSDDELIASMLQSMEVLAQTLAQEFDCGPAQMLQISSHNGHLFILPQINSTYYVVIIVERAAPLLLLMIEIDRVLANLTCDDFAAFEHYAGNVTDSDELNATEIIEAVREWLGKRTLGK